MKNNENIFLSPLELLEQTHHETSSTVTAVHFIISYP